MEQINTMRMDGYVATTKKRENGEQRRLAFVRRVSTSIDSLYRTKKKS